MNRALLSLALIHVISGTAIASEQMSFLSPEVMKALNSVEIISQTLKEDGITPSVLIEIKNNSSHHFQMLEITCGIQKEGRLVDKAQAYFMNVAPGLRASESALYMLSKDTIGADKAECRASIGM